MSEQSALLGCRPSSIQQWSSRLTCVLHIGPIVALPDAALVDDHTTQPQLSNVKFASVIAVRRMIWATWSQEVLQIQLLAILDAAVELDWLRTHKGVLVKTL